MGEPYRPREGERVRVVVPDPGTTNPATYGDEGIVEHVLTFTNTGNYTVRIKDGGWAVAVMPLDQRSRSTVLAMGPETPTGEDGCGFVDAMSMLDDEASVGEWCGTNLARIVPSCPAPTPRPR